MAVKKLIEVALPLEAINAASSREKSIRKGHPSTLHLWFARRPLAAARAVIWSSLVDDPSSHPEEFPTELDQTTERERLFKILENLVVWENSNNEDVIESAKAEIRKSVGEDIPPLLDPFAGGGAIPLEAQRLGIKAYAQDLNPVPVIINRAMLELPPKFNGQRPVNPDARQRGSIDSWTGNVGLAEDVYYYGHLLNDLVYRKIGQYYPTVVLPKEHGGGEATVIAWIWAKTMRCTNPACAKKTPLVRSFDLIKRKGKEQHAELGDAENDLLFKVSSGRSKQPGTVNKSGGGSCVFCKSPLPFSSIREAGVQKEIGETLMSVVVKAHSSRLYLSPDNTQINAARNVIRPDSFGGKLVGKARANVSLYGIDDITDLFSDRQLLALNTFSSALEDIREQIIADSATTNGRDAVNYANAIVTYLSLVIDKCANLWTTSVSWMNDRGALRETFARHAIPMAWDYAEANPFSDAGGSFIQCLKRIVDAIVMLPSKNVIPGIARQFDAQSDSGLRGVIISTDPPYYSNIDYADLSDFFYLWLRRNNRSIYPELFGTIATPKAEELIASDYHGARNSEEARNFFEEGMLSACKNIALAANDDIPVTVYYAFKQNETETVNSVESTASTGWETMLSALIQAGFTITGTWPIATESTGRAVAQKRNALGSSIVLVCRKRSSDAPMVTRREFVSSLKRELKPALDKLQTSNIAPVDLAQSAIGPGIGVYSRYSKVLEADGSEMTVRSALQIINQELDLYFTDQDSDLDRESRFCVELYSQSAFDEIRFFDADVLARAKNTSIEGIASKGALSSGKGIVRLLGRDEIRNVPAPDFCWLFTQQLTHAMETGGIDASARLLKDVLDSRGENARALAYRLFSIADKKEWNQEAFAYNSLVTAWREIESKAAALRATTPVQTTLNI